MIDGLWLVPALPLLGFLLLALFGRRLGRSGAAAVGVGSMGLAALLSLGVAVSFLSSFHQTPAYVQKLWTWLSASGFSPSIALRLDALSLVFMLVVTVVGFLIHLYSAEFMAKDEGYSRFFAYMNLFVGSMLILVLADNLLLLYLGWEGVGLCSYLLIGFWYKDPVNGYAARKAFIITRIGDTSLVIGIIWLYAGLGTLEIQSLLGQAAGRWLPGSSAAVAAAALLLGGAVGKSAQLPLQTWLPDAMAGPTPVSALIHAATMVTAGVYLMVRMHGIFELAPAVLTVTAVIGAVTLLMAGFSALTQSDIKRVLAYSTISQIGYMFLAVGVGAWSAAIFHFLTHAFFKALLFLGAGVIILGLNDEHNMFKMGGLRKKLPLVFWTFLAGACSLAALPLVTAGFYSKDLILWAAWSGPRGGVWLWTAGAAGALLTAAYTFRMVFITFFGPPKAHFHFKPGFRLNAPLLILAFFSLTAGFLEMPETFGNVPVLSRFLGSVLPGLGKGNPSRQLWLQVFSSVLVLAGISTAYAAYRRRFDGKEPFLDITAADRINKFLYDGWGFDTLYDRVFVRPVEWLARVDPHDFIDLPFKGIARLNALFHLLLSRTQTGQLNGYAMGMTIGAVILLALALVLL
jgi:NADH-quinone oxidoreductase subunit L